jgi:uncharacterized protein
MEKGNSGLIAIAIIAIIGAFIVAGIGLKERGSPQDQHLLSVSGTHESEVAPDQAVLVLQVMTRDATAQAASSQNKDLLTNVMAALTAQGLTNNDIETTGVVLQRWTEWNQKDMNYTDHGFEQVTTLKVTLKDLAKVGSVLDAAVNAGANSVQDISFELRPETQEKVKQDALKAATAAARTKAQILADAAGAKLGDIVSLNENSYIMPYLANSKSLMTAVDAPPTPINPAQVTVSASVQLSYEIKER